MNNSREKNENGEQGACKERLIRGSMNSVKDISEN